MKIANEIVQFTRTYLMQGYRLPPNCCKRRWACIAFDNYDVDLRSGSKHYVAIAAYQTMPLDECDAAHRIAETFYKQLLVKQGFLEEVDDASDVDRSVGNVTFNEESGLEHTMLGFGAPDRPPADENDAVEDVFQQDLLIGDEIKPFTQEMVNDYGKFEVDITKAVVPSFTG